MKVQNDLSALSQIMLETGVSAIKQSATQSTSAAPTKTDEAHLSTAANLISQALALPEIRSEKVASVQAALANGTYQVSSSDVAAKLIEQIQANTD